MTKTETKTEAIANPDRFLFVIFGTTLSGDWAEPLRPKHVTQLPKPRKFGKGRGHTRAGTPFRLYDDDHNLYYTGVMWDDGSESQAFAPLNWAMHDSGCSYMMIQEDGRWSIL